MSFVISPTGKVTFTKDPDATLDYAWDFTDLVDASDVISAVEFTPEEGSGITVGTQNLNGAIATAFLSGGVVDNTWGVTCRYTTAGGRVNDRTYYFAIKQQ
jgi:hypothetical protein